MPCAVATYRCAKKNSGKLLTGESTPGTFFYTTLLSAPGPAPASTGILLYVMKNSKTWWWAIVAVAAALLTVIIWQRSILLNYGKKGGSKPHISVKEIRVHDIGDDRISMTAKMMVSNPLLIELNADSLTYELFIDSIKVMESEYVKRISIRSMDSAMITLPLDVDRSRLAAVFSRFERNDSDSASYTLKAKLYLEVPVAGEKVFEKNETRRGPAFRPLKVKTEDRKIEKFGFKHSEVNVTLILENPNLFEIGVKDVDYDLKIGKDLHMRGNLDKTTQISPRSTITLPLEMDVRTKNIGRLAWQVLFEKKHTPFQIRFKCKIATDNDVFKDTQLSITREGRLDDLKK